MRTPQEQHLSNKKHITIAESEVKSGLPKNE